MADARDHDPDDTADTRGPRSVTHDPAAPERPAPPPPTIEPKREPSVADAPAYRGADAPQGSYRQAPPEAPTAAKSSIGPRVELGDFAAGPLGTVDVSLDLGDRLEVALSRRFLRVDAGGGVRLDNSRELPEVVVRSLDVDLGTLALTLDADGIGGAVGAVATAAGREVAAHYDLEPAPDRTLADPWLERHDQDAAGRRRVAELPKARTSVWVHPDSEVRLRVNRRAIELTLSRALTVTVIGLGLGVAAVRYLFASRKVEIERPRDAGLLALLTAPILYVAAWIATRWIRKRLPAPVGVEGYDPWADDARLLHLRQAALALAPPSSSAAPKPARAAPRLPPLAELAGDLRADAPDEHTWLVARLPLPESAGGGTIGVALPHGAAVRAELTALALTLRADSGLRLYADGHPELAGLRLVEVRVRFDTETLSVVTEPELGALPQALLQELLRTTWLPRLPPPARALLGVERRAEGRRVLWHKDLPGGRALTLKAAPGAVVSLRHSEVLTEARITPGLDVELRGAPTPAARLSRVSYRWSDGAIDIVTSPALGALERAAISQFVRHRVAGQLPVALGLRGPESGPKVDAATIAGRTHVAYATDVPQVGPLRLLLDPEDTLAVEIRPFSARVRSERGLLLVADDLQIAFDLRDLLIDREGAITVDATPAPGPYVEALVANLFRELVAPKIAARVPPPPAPDAPWVLHRQVVERLGEVAVVLQPEAAIVVERRADGIHLGTEGLTIEAGDALPPIRVVGASWDPTTGHIALITDPEVGPLVDEVATRVVRRLAGPVLDRLRGVLALPERSATPPPPPPVPGPVLYRKAIPRLGELEIALPRIYFAMISVDTDGRVAATIDGGLRARLRELGLRLILEGAEATVDPFDLAITTDPALGPLEHQILRDLAAPHVAALSGRLWPADAPAPLGHPDSRTIAVFAENSSQGPLSLALPQGGVVRVALDRQMLELECEVGLHIALAGAAWLPDVLLHKLTYTLADGAIDLRFSGIVERYYREAESVSQITEAILAHVLKVLVTPKLPEALLPLGFQRFPLPPPPRVKANQIVLFELPLAPGYGEARLSMEADEMIIVMASEDEVQIKCDRGLLIHLPALRFGIHARTARYHLHSGEVQIGGLGQLENAIVEAIIRKNVRKATGGAPIGGVLDGLPVDKRGRKVLFANKAVQIRMRPGARFTLAFSAAGIDFTAEPPLEVDGPGVLDYELRGFTYSFARGSFSLVLDDDGVLASLFTGVVAETAESQVDKLLRPLLPPAMREPGYTLANDPHTAETIAAVVANFSVRRKAKKAEETASEG
ncbi:MAG: hypothetical protein R3A79_23785 [Nannocystaceae bacterium]